MTQEKNDCVCFPKEGLCEKYSQILGDPYLAEKTCKTLKDWLPENINVSKFKEFGRDNIAYYAASDFTQYMCQTPQKQSACAMAQLSEEIHFQKSRKH